VEGQEKFSHLIASVRQIIVHPANTTGQKGGPGTFPTILRISTDLTWWVGVAFSHD